MINQIYQVRRRNNPDATIHSKKRSKKHKFHSQKSPFISLKASRIPFTRTTLNNEELPYQFLCANVNQNRTANKLTVLLLLQVYNPLNPKKAKHHFDNRNEKVNNQLFLHFSCSCNTNYHRYTSFKLSIVKILPKAAVHRKNTTLVRTFYQKLRFKVYICALLFFFLEW